MNATTLKELALSTAGILSKQNPPLPFLLAEHRPRLKPLEILFHSSLAGQTVREWEDAFHSLPPFSQVQSIFETGGWFYYLALTEPERIPFCFFVFDQEPDEETRRLLTAWSEQSQLLSRALRGASQKHETAQGNLIAQLLHDVQAIMTLQPEDCKNTALHARLEYQKKVNENLLLFIRPLELLPSRLPLADLVHSSLQMVNIPSEKYSLTISASVADMEIDAEFMARAIQEIVWNGLEAGSPSCAIHARQIPASSPFLAKDWVELSFSDSGSGISGDYLGSVTEPFFTTRKNKGHSGFGLALVKKITEAHGGYLKIESEKSQGTQVKLYIPV